MNGRSARAAAVRRFPAALILVFLAAAAGGCHWGFSEKAYAPSAPPKERPPAATAPAVPPAGATAAPVPQAPQEETPPAVLAPPSPSDSGPAPAAPVAGEQGTSPGAAGPAAAETVPPAAANGAGAGDDEKAPAAVPNETARKRRPAVTGAANGAKPSPAVQRARGREPVWAKGNEELVYRVRFLGVTMGYARFSFKGKAVVDGKETYHVSVRAWTSDFLSLIYPVNDKIEYYLDAGSLAPVRQEFTKLGDEKDYVALYDQEKGTIVQKYKDTGEVRRKVDAAPNVYDPVSVAYYFRAWELGVESRALQCYAGRKLWHISAKSLGVEKIMTDKGPVETIVIQPVIRHEGKIDNKGDIRLWMTNDARHVPVRLYAKFKKIRMWTLYGELMPHDERG